MSELSELTALMQQLVATVASHTETINAIGETQNAIANSADSEVEVDSEVKVPNVSTVAPVKIRNDQYTFRFSVTKELASEIPILSD